MINEIGIRIIKNMTSEERKEREREIIVQWITDIVYFRLKGAKYREIPAYKKLKEYFGQNDICSLAVLEEVEIIIRQMKSQQYTTRYYNSRNN